MIASDRQVRYAFDLLERAGYGTQHVEEQHGRLCAPKDIGRSVEGWLHNMDVEQISRLIDRLKKELDE